MSGIIAVIAGAACGVLSGMGIGGGTLLVVWMTAVMGIQQREAQGINLLFFVPTAVSALIFHHKNGLIRWKLVLPAAISGSLVAIGTSILAANLDTDLLRKLFGGFLLLVGIKELFYRERKAR